MAHDKQTSARPAAADMTAWERPLLQSNNGIDALFALSRLAGIDAYQPRSAWSSAVTRTRVRNRRRLLFAFLRRELKERPGDSFTSAVPLVLGWMLLATNCPFAPHHCAELMACIERDPGYRNRKALLQLPETSRRRERVLAIELLLAALSSADTSKYVDDRSRGLWGRVRGWMVTPTPRQLQPFVKTELGR